MQFFHINECAEWCRNHGAEVGDGFRLLPDPDLDHASRIEFATEADIGLGPRAVEGCVVALGEWDSCLLWFTDWEIWQSTEDWPAFYALRGARGETTSLGNKPGHLFIREEVGELSRFLLPATTNGWDAHVLPSCGGRILRRVFVSHDGWAELRSAMPEELQLGTV